MSLFKHLGRNDTCWCGSEKKYKKCCFEIHQELKEFANKGYPIPKMNCLNTYIEINGIKQACKLTTEILDALSDIIKPGVSTNEINNWVDAYTRKHGAIPAPLNYKGFPKSICTSINEVVCHGIPSERVLEEGDIINVDVTCIKNGFYGDSCRMYKVGNVSESISTPSYWSLHFCSYSLSLSSRDLCSLLNKGWYLIRLIKSFEY